MSETSFRKLPGRAVGIDGIVRLWLADDYILASHSTFGVERYRRYFFRDIEAVIIRNTNVRFGWNLAFGILGVIFAGAAGLFRFTSVFESSEDFAQAGFIVFAVLAGICVAFALINTLLGPSCRVYFQTPAGLQDLRAPRRMPKALRMLDLVEAVIAEAQSREVAPSPAPSPAPAPAVTPAAMDTAATAPATASEEGAG